MVDFYDPMDSFKDQFDAADSARVNAAKAAVTPVASAQRNLAKAAATTNVVTLLQNANQALVKGGAISLQAIQEEKTRAIDQARINDFNRESAADVEQMISDHTVAVNQVASDAIEPMLDDLQQTQRRRFQAATELANATEERGSILNPLKYLVGSVKMARLENRIDLESNLQLEQQAAISQARDIANKRIVDFNTTQGLQAVTKQKTTAAYLQSGQEAWDASIKSDTAAGLQIQKTAEGLRMSASTYSEWTRYWDGVKRQKEEDDTDLVHYVYGIQSGNFGAVMTDAQKRQTSTLIKTITANDPSALTALHYGLFQFKKGSKTNNGYTSQNAVQAIIDSGSTSAAYTVSLLAGDTNTANLLKAGAQNLQAASVAGAMRQALKDQIPKTVNDYADRVNAIDKMSDMEVKMQADASLNTQQKAQAIKVAEASARNANPGDLLKNTAAEIEKGFTLSPTGAEIPGYASKLQLPPLDPKKSVEENAKIQRAALATIAQQFELTLEQAAVYTNPAVVAAMQQNPGLDGTAGVMAGVYEAGLKLGRTPDRLINEIPALFSHFAYAEGTKKESAAVGTLSNLGAVFTPRYYTPTPVVRKSVFGGLSEGTAADRNMNILNPAEFGNYLQRKKIIQGNIQRFKQAAKDVPEYGGSAEQSDINAAKAGFVRDFQ